MKKYFLTFALALLAALCAVGAQAQSPSNADAANAALKEQVAKLSEKIRQMEEAYAKQTQEELARYAKLRDENRALKNELRGLKLDLAQARASGGAAAATAAAQTQPAQTATAKKYELPKDDQPKVEKRDTAQEKKKDDSIWNHIFPF